MTQPNVPTICEKMSIGRKIGLFLDHLQAGNEVKVKGCTYVWLDNHITHTTKDTYGETQYFGIDGLAIKGIELNSQKPHYMGQSDMPIHAFIQLVENVKEEDWVGMLGGIALKSMNKKR